MCSDSWGAPVSFGGACWGAQAPTHFCPLAPPHQLWFINFQPPRPVLPSRALWPARAHAQGLAPGLGVAPAPREGPHVTVEAQISPWAAQAGHREGLWGLPQAEAPTCPCTPPPTHTHPFGSWVPAQRWLCLMSPPGRGPWGWLQSRGRLGPSAGAGVEAGQPARPGEQGAGSPAGRSRVQSALGRCPGAGSRGSTGDASLGRAREALSLTQQEAHGHRQPGIRTSHPAPPPANHQPGPGFMGYPTITHQGAKVSVQAV